MIVVAGGNVFIGGSWCRSRGALGRYAVLHLHVPVPVLIVRLPFGRPTLPLAALALTLITHLRVALAIVLVRRVAAVGFPARLLLGDALAQAGNLLDARRALGLELFPFLLCKLGRLSTRSRPSITIRTLRLPHTPSPSVSLETSLAPGVTSLANSIKARDVL